MTSEQNGPFAHADGGDGQEDDDNISITSTIDEPEGDFDVEELLAERENPTRPGEIQFLIKWEGYPMDQCTWEPREHLGDGVYEGWEEAKAEIRAGRRQPFDMQGYYNAIQQASFAKSERHMRRNAKRKRLGLPLTMPLPVESPVTSSMASRETSKDGSDREEEAMEVDETDPGHIPKSPQSGAPTQTQKVIKQKIFQGIPSAKPRTEAPMDSRKGSKTESRRPSITRSPKSSPKPLSRPSQEPVSKSRQSNSSTITGYQGTARPPVSRRPSINIDTRVSKQTPGKPPTPIARTSSSSAPSSSVAAPIRSSSSLRAKFSGKRATRTRPEVRSIPNVFTGGKRRQQRKNLRDVMTDPTKDPKQFSSMHIQNIARKKGIEMNDAAPVHISSIPAAFILGNNPAQPKAPEENQTEIQANSNAESPTSQPTPISHGVSANSPDNTNGAAPKKPKKSVRFSDADDLPAVSDNFDPVLDEHYRFESPEVDPDISVASTGATKKLSLANYQGRLHMHTVSKTCSFGSQNGSAEVQVKFVDIPRQIEPSISAFLRDEKLSFHLVCSSCDFMTQRGYLYQEIYCSGMLDAEAEESAPALENIAEHMRQRSSGLYLAKSEYSILIYPTKCNGWEGVAGDQMEQDSTDSALRYLIFKPLIDVRHYPNNADLPAELTSRESQSTIERLAKVVMDLDFSTMTTHNGKDQDKQIFMLMFPCSDFDLMRVITLWLRGCRPDCRIFTSEVKGSFAKFVEHSRRGAGTIIFHEEVTTKIRRIPLIWQMIERGTNYTFWDLATGRRTPPRYPSRLDFELKPNQHYLTRLFPSGRAFLITPSFVISDPIKFYEFMQWFIRVCHNPRYLIVAPSDFSLWLQILCLEKSREWGRYQEDHIGEPKLNDILYTRGLTKDRTDALARAWQLLRKIMADYGDEEAHIDVRRVMWAPHNINPNDEQSLVNWFCWWSTMSLDRYRRFYVLGSNAKHEDRAYRMVRVPNYDPDQVLQPDEALEEHKTRKEADEQKLLDFWEAQGAGATLVATAEEDGSNSKADNQGVKSPGKVSTAQRQGSLLSQNELGFPSRLFASDRAHELKMWLINLKHEFVISWATLFWQAVSWQDVPMADHFGDHRCEYANFTHWLSACTKFRKSKNTWIGLFYTPDGDWDPARPSHTYKRHPWIAVYRPVNPHLGEAKYSETELFIWDLSLEREADLSDMQLRLIDFVRRESAKLVGPEYHLGRVWYSNRTRYPTSPQDHPLDVTCQHIGEMLADARYWLPPYEQVIQTRGWSQLPLSYVARRIEQVDRAADRRGHLQPFPKHYSDAEEPLSCVFLPPRGTVKHSRCYNDLYEAAYENRVKDDACQEFRYSYRPTLEWYEEQVREGRHFAHICVDVGDRIVDRLPKVKGSKPR